MLRVSLLIMGEASLTREHCYLLVLRYQVVLITEKGEGRRPCSEDATKNKDGAKPVTST